MLRSNAAFFRGFFYISLKPCVRFDWWAVVQKRHHVAWSIRHPYLLIVSRLLFEPGFAAQL